VKCKKVELLWVVSCMEWCSGCGCDVLVFAVGLSQINCSFKWRRG